jgi:hypothetical protein
MCDGYEADGPQCWSEKWRKARKPHRCCACGETIQPGHTYHYLSGIWDGSAEDYKHCARCWTIFDALEDRTEGVALLLNCGETWESAFGEAPPPELAALAFALPGEISFQPNTPEAP